MAAGLGPASALWPVDVALAELLEVDATLAVLLTAGPSRVYSLMAPAGAVLPYVVIGESTEGASTAPTLMRHGSAVSVTLHLWHSDTQSKAGVLAVYNALRRLLHLTAVTLDGHRFLRGSLELVTIMADADGQSSHGVARYTVLSQWESDVYLMPVRREALALELYPLYDGIGPNATSGQAMMPTDGIVAHGAHFDTGAIGGITLARAALPVNASASGFTVVVAGKCAPIDDVYKTLVDRTNAAGEYALWCEWPSLVGVPTLAYGVSGAAGYESGTLALPGVGAYVVALRYTRTEAHGARLKSYLFGGGNGVPQAPSGVNVGGALLDDVGQHVYLGGHPGYADGAVDYVGSLFTWSEALTDQEIADAMAFVAATFPVVHP